MIIEVKVKKINEVIRCVIVVDDAWPTKGESQNKIKMERGIEEKDLGVNWVQLEGHHKKGLRSKQHWDPEISAYLSNSLEQISVLITESEEFIFQIYLWKSLRDIKFEIWFFIYQNRIFKHEGFWFILPIRIGQESHIIQIGTRCRYYRDFSGDSLG